MEAVIRLAAVSRRVAGVLLVAVLLVAVLLAVVLLAVVLLVVVLLVVGVLQVVVLPGAAVDMVHPVVHHPVDMVHRAAAHHPVDMVHRAAERLPVATVHPAAALHPAVAVTVRLNTVRLPTVAVVLRRRRINRVHLRPAVAAPASKRAKPSHLAGTR